MVRIEIRIQAPMRVAGPIHTIHSVYSIVVESSDGDQFGMLPHPLQITLDLPAVDRIHDDDQIGRIVSQKFRLHDDSISQRSLGREDMANVLRLQRQAAEPRAIRRIHGTRLFRNEHLNCCTDALLYHYYGVKKKLLKALHARRTKP